MEATSRYVVACAAILLLSWATEAESRRRPRKEKRVRGIRRDTVLREDSVKAGESAQLRAGPGDGFGPLELLPEGTSLQVVELDGRWARVRVGKLRGWLLRRSLTGYSTISESGDVPSGAEGWGGNTSFNVTVASEDAQLRAAATLDAEVLGAEARGARLVVLGRDQGRRWLRVRRSDGVEGWIESSQVTSSITAAIEPSSVAEQREQPVAAWQRTRLARTRLATRLGVGYRSLSMDFTSAGRGTSANTIINAQAMAASADADLTLRSAGRRFQVGLDARYRTSYARPGIEVIQAEGPVGDVQFSMHEMQAGIRLGMVVADVEFAARAGGRYDVFLTQSIDNPGLLPRESLTAVVTGARVDWYRFFPTVVLSLRGDVVVFGRQQQTTGLEDGEESVVRGVWAELRAAYRLSPQFDVVAAFHQSWARYTWSGMSARNPDVMHSGRVDRSLDLGVGIAHRF